jgi:hypothetical protein
MERMRNPAIPTPALTLDSSFQIHSPTTKEAKLSQIIGLIVVRQAGTEEKTIKITNEAGMLLKTNKTRTFCHPK